jgi:hypothetical protein
MCAELGSWFGLSRSTLDTEMVRAILLVAVANMLELLMVVPKTNEWATGSKYYMQL